MSLLAQTDRRYNSHTVDDRKERIALNTHISTMFPYWKDAAILAIPMG
jgi:hypothetical protein